MAGQLGTRHLRTIVLAGVAGSIMEWYDFGLYGVFASGFFARPLGGVVFGYVGDRLGRKAALTASVLLMAVPTLATTLAWLGSAGLRPSSPPT